MYNTPFCICYTEKYSINCITSHCTNQQTRSVFIYLSCNVLLIFFWGTEYFTGDRRLRVAIILWNLWLLSSVWFSVITYFLATKTMQVSHHVLIIHMYAYYTPRFNEVERGIYWFHLVRLSVCPSVRLSSVRLWTESCPLCIFNHTRRIHFILAHFIKQLQNICRV